MHHYETHLGANAESRVGHAQAGSEEQKQSIESQPHQLPLRFFSQSSRTHDTGLNGLTRSPRCKSPSLIDSTGSVDSLLAFCSDAGPAARDRNPAEPDIAGEVAVKR